MATQPKLMTAEEFIQLPDDGTCQELVRGEVRSMPPPAPRHGEVALRVGIRAGLHVETHQLGRVYGAETGWRIHHDPDTVRAPDFAFVAEGRLPPGPSPSSYPDLVPDLVAEVVSPDDRAKDIQEKMRDWLQAGVRLAWVLYPDTRSIAVYRSGADIRLLGPDGELDGSDVLPGFHCLVQELFPG